MDLTAIQEWILALVGTPWVLLVVYLLATIDGFFPPLPSESVVIAAAALIVSGEGPSLWYLLGAAALGAFTGDVIAYHIGMALPIRRMRLLNNVRGRRAVAWAELALQRRATVFLMSARFVPVGRVAVNMTAGALRFSRARFLLTVSAAGLLWAGYATALGMAAGEFLAEHPLLAAGAGVVLGLGSGVLLDWLLGRLNARLARRREAEEHRGTRVGEALLRGTAPPVVRDPFGRPVPQGPAELRRHPDEDQEPEPPARVD